MVLRLSKNDFNIFFHKEIMTVAIAKGLSSDKVKSI